VKQRQIFTLILMISLAVSLATGISHSNSLADMGDEALVSQERGHVFEIRKGQDSKIVKEFNARAGQKIRLLSFGSTSLDQLRTNLRPAGADGLFDLGNDQELRIVGVSSEIISSIQIELDQSGLVPTFGDDFDSLSLDLEDEAGQPKGTWRTHFEYGCLNTRTLVNNGELQGYADRLFSGTAEASLNLDPFRVSDGDLEIVAEPLKEDIRQFTWGRSYSSGLLTSKGSFSQKYGVFEIRAKMPRRKGLWPAFWLLPANNTWPPELDILEILGDNPQKLYVSWHSNVGGTHWSETKTIDVPDTSTEFHTYSIDWTKDTINWFCDDIQVARKSTPEDFRQPIYGLLNLAVGGGWPGAPDTTTEFPAKYSIDWVRVYARRNPR
jgi:Glycosyl hydrolases family 16